MSNRNATVGVTANPVRSCEPRDNVMLAGVLNSILGENRYLNFQVYELASSNQHLKADVKELQVKIYNQSQAFTQLFEYLGLYKDALSASERRLHELESMLAVSRALKIQCSCNDLSEATFDPRNQQNKAEACRLRTALVGGMVDQAAKGWEESGIGLPKEQTPQEFISVNDVDSRATAVEEGFKG